MELRRNVTVKGYQHYEVSEDGFVFNKLTGKQLQGAKNKQGYLRVTLVSCTGTRKDFYVHRLVCLAYHECPSELHEVHHKNEIRDDNRRVNVEWVTRAENMKHVHNGWLNRKWAKKAMTVQSSVPVDYSGDFTDPIEDGDDLPF